MEIRLEHLPRTADVLPGDILVTGGASGSFPKGIQVGELRTIKQPAFGLYQDAEVVPAVDFSRLEEVLIVKRSFIPDFEVSSESLSPMSDPLP